MQHTEFKEVFKKFQSNKLFIDEVYGDTHYSDVLVLSDCAEIALTKRSLVFCLSQNDVGGLCGYLALITAGAVPLMLSSSIQPEKLKTLLDAYQPSYLWLPTARVNEVNSAQLKYQYREYSLMRLPNENYNIHNSVALLLSTSGSTGSPKFVKLSYRNIISNSKSIAEYLELSEKDLPITTLPPTYSYGLSIIHSHILVGATIAITNKTFFEHEFWSFLKKVSATSFGGVPYHYEMLKKLKFTRMELTSLRTLTQAGGRMDVALIKEFATHCSSKGIRFFTMYGQTEATSRMSYLSSTKTIAKAGSIGTAVPGGKFWLENDCGNIIEAPDIAGELVYKGPNVSMGYSSGYGDLIKDDDNHGLLHTGDIAKRDADGDYYIVGRLKRFIKIFGNRINLQEVEEFLNSYGYVAACSGQDDQLEIYLLDLDVVHAMQIKKLVSNYLQIAPLGLAIYLIKSIPYGESGKVQYADLRPEIGDRLA